jgi:hypothetical protein
MALAIVVSSGVSAGQTAAEVIRFHYAPMGASGNVRLVPAPNGAPAVRSAWLGGPAEPVNRQVAPTHIVTFLHPYSGQNINVPIIFPLGTPRVEHRLDRVVYNYSTYQIRAHFLADGSVEVSYNSGALRPLAFQ